MECEIRVAQKEDSVDMSRVIIAALRRTSAQDYSQEIIERVEKSFSPAAKVPVLVDGSLVVTESAAIQLYLADKYPQAGFIPETVEDRAQTYRWISSW